MSPLLELRNIHLAYGALEVLHGVSLEVGEGEIVSLIGSNGAGKSSTLMCAAGIHRAKSGELRFRGRDISGLPAHSLVSMGLALVPEGRRIFPRLTVMENLELGAFSMKSRAGFMPQLEYCFALFPILEERASQPGGTLSGGEQQMLAIARALMSRPRLLLLDEPSMGVAPLLTKRIFDTIVELNARGMTILLVEQNANLALKTASRAYVLETGRITAKDHAATLLRDPRIRESYLGG